MNENLLNNFSYNQLKEYANELQIDIKRSKSAMIESLLVVFKKYEKYKKEKITKYTTIKQLGHGEEGVTYHVVDRKGREFAKKTFKKHKSSNSLIREADFQKRAADLDIAPNIIDVDTVSKYILMEKLDKHLIDVIVEQNGELTRKQQKQIIFIFQELDKAGVFHGDANIMNYMVREDSIYIIDFGMSKEITSSLITKLGTNKPNISIMTLGFILKLKHHNCSQSSYQYLKKYLTDDQIVIYSI
ncbi:MAG: protein kinase domain-containing protein [Promethearchaeota archaeon]|jgi:tRNA A-37 threonylcarbamoyl transferase component Bud32